MHKTSAAQDAPCEIRVGQVGLTQVRLRSIDPEPIRLELRARFRGEFVGDDIDAIVNNPQIASFGYSEAQAKEKALGSRGSRLTLESLQAQMAEGGIKELPVIIKADVQGSAEVLADTLAKLSDERVKIRTIHTGVTSSRSKYQSKKP